MKRIIISFLLLLGGGTPLFAQGAYVSGAITAVDGGTECATTNGFVSIPVGTSATVSFSVSGTFSATLQFVTTVDGANFSTVNAFPPNSSTAVTSTTGAGTWTVAIPAMATFCVRSSAYVSGTANVNMRNSTAVSASALIGGSGGGGGGGSGTVSGQASGVIPLGTTATTITQQSHLDDGNTTAGTITSSESFTTTNVLAAKQRGSTYYADQFSGADASIKINACLTAAAALFYGGICDATALSNGNQFISQQINIPAQTSLILPTSATWIVTITNGTSSGIDSFGGSSIIGTSPAGAGCTMNIIAGATANVASLWKTDTGAGENSYVNAGNFCLLNAAGGTVTNLADVEDLADNSWVHDIFAQNYTGNAWLITNDAFMTFTRIQGYASQSSPASGTYSAGGVPLTFGTSGVAYNESLLIEGSTFNAPKTGNSNAVFTGPNTGITFLEDYFEGNGTVDTSTTMISIAAANKGIRFIGGGVNDFCASACASKYAFTSAMTSQFGVEAMYGYNASWINDTGNGVTVPNSGTTYTTYAPYSVSPSFTVSATVNNNNLGATPAGGVTVQNTTAAANGAQQWSPPMVWCGQGWKTTATAASESVCYRMYNNTVQGSTTPNSQLFTQIAVNGGSYSTVMEIDGSGNIYPSGVVSPGGNAIVDSNFGPWLATAATGGAVDGFTITPAATANPATVTLGATGSDSNINLTLAAKGTGAVQSSAFKSTVATGTAPLVVASTTTVPNLTVSNHPTVQFCGTTTTCSHTAETSPKIVFGSAPLVTGTPSTATITGISPAFTATADYVCSVSAPGATAATALLGVTNVSASSFTITGPAAVTTVISYLCVGF